ncbi:unnamed protein product [Kluyveromyces dobzhanskii CBS 2104]|uniref:WGS project CCBQ000000000 data, contig 00015 n=1 Tax=Kluyveromyces dobzhanskii CBS 2104 TaxID=1427455 RepID=A0A0A8LC45_9SACH|nr:unnamed protein product [Kluyveromyces dobzhanskii CBS 2104]
MDRDTVRILSLILGMYVAAILLTMYNKWMFDPNRSMHIPYPLLVTGLHQTQLWGMAYFYLRWKGQLTPQNLNKGDWKYYVKYILPTAVATAGDIGLGNISFKYVPFTVYTIVKSSTIAFVLFFGCLFKVETPSWKLFFIVATMFFGVVLMGFKPLSSDISESHGEIQETFGIILVVISCALGGFRWVYVKVILNHKKNTVVLPPNNSDDEHMQVSGPIAKKNPVITLYQLALPMTILLFTTSFIVERPFPDVFRSELMTWENHSKLVALARGIALLTLPSCLVFVLTMCEFGILQVAPVLTLSVTGIIKELFTVFLGMLVFDERLGLYNWIGMLVVLIDVCYYNYYRYLQRNQQEETQGGYHLLENASRLDSIVDEDDKKTNIPEVEFELQDSRDSTTVWELDSLSSKKSLDINLNQNKTGSSMETKTLTDENSFKKSS